MTGVTTNHKVTPRQMKWLQSGGIDEVERFVRALTRRLNADFSVSIILPWEPFFAVLSKKGRGPKPRFAPAGGDFDNVERHAREYNRKWERNGFEVEVATGSALFGLEHDEIGVCMNWHGHRDASRICGAIDRLFARHE